MPSTVSILSAAPACLHSLGAKPEPRIDTDGQRRRLLRRVNALEDGESQVLTSPAVQEEAATLIAGLVFVGE